MPSCRYTNNPFNSSDFVWSFDDKYGNCYTFNSGADENRVDLKQSSIAGPDYGLQLTLYVNIYEGLLVRMKANGFGLVIRIGNSSYSTYYLNSGIFVSSNFESSIAIRREVKITMVNSNCEIDSDSPKFMPDMDLYNLIGRSDYEYTQQLCFA